MSERDNETNDELAARIQEAIRGVTERIRGYVESVNTFAGEYNAEVERLRLLIVRLRKCLDRLRELADGLDDINQKIMLLGTKIENLQRRVTAEVEAAGAGCRQALQDIEAELRGFEELPGEFSIDIKTLRTQVTDLEGLIESLCGEADDTISKMLTTKSAQINETLDRMAARDNGSGGEGGESKSGSENVSGSGEGLGLPTPQGQGGRTMTGTLTPGYGNVRSRIADLQATRLAPTSPESEARRQAEDGYRRSREDRQRRQRRQRRQGRNIISPGRFPQPPETQRVPENDGFMSRTSRFDGVGGWQTPEKLESLSRTRPVRTLAVLKNKKKKKTKKKKHRKRNKKTRGRNRRKKRSRKR